MTSPLEMYSKFVLANHFCSAKSCNWLENGQWPTAISGSVLVPPFPLLDELDNK